EIGNHGVEVTRLEAEVERLRAELTRYCGHYPPCHPVAQGTKAQHWERAKRAEADVERLRAEYAQNIENFYKSVASGENARIRAEALARELAVVLERVEFLGGESYDYCVHPDCWAAFEGTPEAGKHNPNCALRAALARAREMGLI